MRTVILTSILFCFGLGVNAQAKNDKLLKMATNEYKNLRYAYAIPLYKASLKEDPKNTFALSSLANSYKVNNQYDSAIKYFELAKSMGANVGSNLAELYANKGNYSNALKDKSVYTLNEARYKGFENIEQFKIDSLDYTLQYLNLNTPFNENAIVLYNNFIVFESNRANKIKGTNEFGWDASAFSKLYKTNNLAITSWDSVKRADWVEKTPTAALSDLTAATSNDNSTFSKKYDFKSIPFNDEGVILFDKDLSAKYNVGAISFTADSATAYFTRNLVNTNKVHQLEIWSASKITSSWTNMKKLSFNNNDASYAHPSISADGNTLYLISDQVGGQGGTDIYYTKKDANGQWGGLINAGIIVNSSANELYPIVSEGELYFSSNGHAGLGGLDIYKAVATNGKITSIENLGYPVNSSMDDMSYTKQGSKGYFVSNRYGSDDILSFDYKQVKVLLKGKVELSDGTKPVIKLNLFNNANTLLESVNTDLNGFYSVYVRPNRLFQIQAIEPKGNKADAAINSKGYIGNPAVGYSKTLTTMTINMPAPPPPVVEKVSFKNIIDSLKSLTDDYVIFHHDFDKVTLERSHKAAYKKLQARIHKLKGARILVVSAADCKGTDEYNEKLSARRSAYLTKNLQNKAKMNTYISLHVGERILAEPCDEKATRKQQLENRYSYIFIEKN
jgi:hypothetical protein